MLFEVSTSILAGGLVGYSYLQKSGGIGDDHAKIVNIARNCGLVSKDGKEIRIHRKDKNKHFTEYVYQMPQGLSYNQFLLKIDNFNDGLNIKKIVPDISFSDFKNINWKGDIIKQLKTIIEQKKKLNKEVEIEFDGMLRFKVYDQQLTDEFIFDEELFKKLKGWKVPIGIDRSNKLIMHDFEMYPHLALGGATRYGKSNFLNMLIVALIHSQSENVTFTLIDLKGGVEFGDYEHLKHVKQIAFEPEEALDALKEAYEDMRAMQKKLRSVKKKKVQDAGIKERHFIIIDEVGELNPAEAVSSDERKLKEQCQTYMSQIARLGAGLGFRQILATQYPTGDVIPRQCKQNSDAKLSFKVRNATASRVVLDEEGAEKLPRIKGRAIYQIDQKHILQTPLIESDTIEKTIQPHINIRPRKERVEMNEKRDTTSTKGRKHSLIIEETELS